MEGEVSETGLEAPKPSNDNRMQATVDTLEAMFMRAESDLDLIAQKLESEFGEQNEGTVNPAATLSKLNDVKEQCAAVAQEAQEINKAQMNAVKYFKDSITAACSALMRLQMEAGVGDGKPAELEDFEQLAGVTMASPGEEASAGAEQAGQAAGPVPRDLSPSERRSGSEFVEVSDNEFSGVSSLTKGRVKLDEVNSVYRILWQHFKKEGNSKPLSRDAMYKMGLVVCGQTGEAKLKVLQALKVLSMNRQGEIVLL